jgi:hypothetical protein
MPPGADPNRILFTGENPYIRLAHKPDGELTARTSLWKVIFSPAGPGNALFIVSELTGQKPRIYSDNLNMARWFQKNIANWQHKPFGDESLEVIQADFDAYGDIRSFWTETISSRDEDIEMTWYDIGEPYNIARAPGSNPPRPFGVYACMIPSGGARLTINGKSVSGRTFLVSEHPNTQAQSSLAFSESWLVPQGHKL